MVCFEMSFDSPMSAGIQTTVEPSGWFGTSKYYSKNILYTDDSGFLPQMDIYLIYNHAGGFGSSFPLTGFLNDYCGLIYNYQARKQPNEVFALNYELAFIPYNYEEEFIGRAFIEDNRFVNDNATKVLNLYYSTTEKYFQGDTKGKGNHVSITNVALDTIDRTITFTHQEASATSWAICDAEGNILFASNRESGTSTTKVIYFKTRHSRL